jgi:outer membrane protein assembly factor BamB
MMLTSLLKPLFAIALIGALPGQSVEPQSSSASASWPGLWGPARNGAAAAGVQTPTRLRQLWRHPAAGGYSEVASDGKRAYTMELKDGVDYVVAFDAQSGREQWRARVAETYKGHDGSHDGPISTPALAGSDLYALGPNGHFVALDAATGKERWRHDLVKAFGVAGPAYGFGSSPLVDGNLVILQTGGEKSGGLMAFDRATGKQAWHASHAKTPAYASAVLATIAGTRQIIAGGGDNTFAVSPADGGLLWSFKGPSAGEELSNSPMVLPDDRVLLSFWGELVALKVAKQGETLTATQLWRSPRIRNVMGPTIHKDGFLYGFASGMLVCLDASNGEAKWRQRTYEGSLVGLGDHMLLLGRGSGELHVIRASPDGYSEVMKTPVFTPGATSITGPSVAGNKIFLRNVEEIVAFQIEG